MMNARLLLVSLALLASSCASIPERPIEDAAILAADQAPKLLDQCSRSTPQSGEGTWAPGWRDIHSLEELLPAALEGERFDGMPASKPPQGWRRQYVGIVRGGRKLIYGNYFPATTSFSRIDWRSESVVVCDGGSNFFGIEYDIDAGRITHLAFNGSPPRM